MLGAYFHQLLIYVFKDEKSKIMKKWKFSYGFSTRTNIALNKIYILELKCQLKFKIQFSNQSLSSLSWNKPLSGWLLHKYWALTLFDTYFWLKRIKIKFKNWERKIKRSWMEALWIILNWLYVQFLLRRVFLGRGQLSCCFLVFEIKNRWRKI